MASRTEIGDISSLDDVHAKSLGRALDNLLSLEHVELAYAEIVDGLPTEASMTESYERLPTHPVFALGHANVCEEALIKTRQFRRDFSTSQLGFPEKLLYAFQKTSVGTEEFHLRLIELAAVACHNIAAYLYNLDEGTHKHQLHRDWFEQESEEGTPGRDRYGSNLPHTPYFQKGFHFPERYPQGLADTVGYWAEGKIFGGVVLFDRGETETECKAVWMLDHRMRGPTTLFPPSQAELQSLINFLRADAQEVKNVECPLPIHATTDHRPRWHLVDAFSDYHIFRDKFERKARSGPWTKHRGSHLRPIDGYDWPEISDDNFLSLQMLQKHWGQETDEAEVAAAKARLRYITPSSPVWDRYKDLQLTSVEDDDNAKVSQSTEIKEPDENGASV